MLNVELSLLGVLCLASCDSYHVVDVIYRATTREVVYRTGNTLEDRTDSDGTTQALNELVADVTNLEVRNYQYVISFMACARLFENRIESVTRRI